MVGLDSEDPLSLDFDMAVAARGARADVDAIRKRGTGGDDYGYVDANDLPDGMTTV